MLSKTYQPADNQTRLEVSRGRQLLNTTVYEVPVMNRSHAEITICSLLAFDCST